CVYTTTLLRVWQETDQANNNSYCTQVVTYVDFIPPTITDCPAGITVQCLAAVPAPDVTLVTATHQFDPCETGSPLIQHYSDVTNGMVITRTYRAYDACSNYAQCVQTITVTGDTTAPVVTCSPSVTSNSTSLSGAVVTFSVTVTDNCDPNPTVTCTPLSGSTFPIGVTVVGCTAQD